MAEIGDLTRLGRRFARGSSGSDNEVQEVFALRSDLPLAAYRLHPAEVDAVVSVPLAALLDLFEGRQAAAPGVELRRGAISSAPRRCHDRRVRGGRP